MSSPPLRRFIAGAEAVCVFNLGVYVLRYWRGGKQGIGNHWRGGRRSSGAA